MRLTHLAHACGLIAIGMAASVAVSYLGGTWLWCALALALMCVALVSEWRRDRGDAETSHVESEWITSDD